MGDRSIEIHGLQRGLALLLGRTRVQRAHIMKSVGELDDDDADILAHRHKDLADILRLLFLLGIERNLTDLGHAVHHDRHVLAEFLPYLVQCRFGILHHVVKKRGADRIRIHEIVQQNGRHGQRMRYIFFSRGAHLPLVRLVRKPVSAHYFIRIIRLFACGDLLH